MDNHADKCIRCGRRHVTAKRAARCIERLEQERTGNKGPHPETLLFHALMDSGDQPNALRWNQHANPLQYERAQLAWKWANDRTLSDEDRYRIAGEIGNLHNRETEARIKEREAWVAEDRPPHKRGFNETLAFDMVAAGVDRLRHGIGRPPSIPAGDRNPTIQECVESVEWTKQQITAILAQHEGNGR